MNLKQTQAYFLTSKWLNTPKSFSKIQNVKTKVSNIENEQHYMLRKRLFFIGLDIEKNLTANRKEHIQIVLITYWINISSTNKQKNKTKHVPDIVYLKT